MRLRRNVWLAVAAILAGSVGCSGGSPPPPTPQPQGGKIAVYVSTIPGSAESLTELQQVKKAGFDAVINYSSLNGTVEGIHEYLDAADELQVGVVFSVKDLLGETDTDEDADNVMRHQRQYGREGDVSNDAQITTLVDEFIDYPAVQSVLISDELPTGPENLEQWLPYLEKRHDQISSVRPTSAVFYWNPDNLAFYEAVGRATDQLQIDFYPIPYSSKYGSVEQISDIGDTLWRVAGPDGWFVLQAFAWDASHPEGRALGFPEGSPPPTTKQMVDMARLAVEGRGNGGAMNLAFYALGDPAAVSLTSMQEAIRQIRGAEWWKSRGN